MEFEGIKVGDQVIVKDRLVEVTHVTPQRFKAGGTMFSKKDGYQIGKKGWFTKIARKAEGEYLENTQKKESLHIAYRYANITNDIIQSADYNNSKYTKEQAEKIEKLAKEFHFSIQSILKGECYDRADN